jgi:hypothetical protein
MQQTHDEPFIIGTAPRQSTGQRALSVLDHGGAYIALSLAYAILWLPMKVLPVVAVLGVLCELGMSWTYYHYRHEIYGTVMSLVMVLVVIFAAGALIRLQTWLIITRERFRW